MIRLDFSGWRWVRVALILALGIVLTHCGSNPTEVDPTFTNVYSIIKSNNCTECHVPGGNATVDYQVKLDFSTQTTAYQTLIGSKVSSITNVGTCGSVKIVSSGSPDQSYLAAVLIMAYSKDNFAGVTGCTPIKDHLQSTNLSDSEKNTLTSWIQNGAKND